MTSVPENKEDGLGPIDLEDFLKPMEDCGLSDIVIPLTIPMICLIVMLYIIICK